MKLWITKLIPKVGADAYEGGVRTGVAATERDAWEELAGFLDGCYPCEIEDGMTDEQVRDAVMAALDESEEAESYGIEEQGLTIDIPGQELLETIARMQTEEETENGYSWEDACSTINDLIEQARKITGIAPGHPKYCPNCNYKAEQCRCDSDGLEDAL